jgi:hypothetical protein
MLQLLLSDFFAQGKMFFARSRKYIMVRIFKSHYKILYFAYDRALQLLLSDFSHKARCFLLEVGSILWSGSLGPIIMCLDRQAVD